MRNSTLGPLISFTAAMVSLIAPATCAQTSAKSEADGRTNSNHIAVLVGHAFSATKYARRVRVLPDGKLQFVRNERYPTQIARDAEGRLMMQYVGDELAPECDQPTVLVPPPCPSWTVFVIDPVAQSVTHWTLGKLGAQAAVDMPLSLEDEERAAQTASEMPEIAPEFDSHASTVTMDLGEKIVDGIPAHGVRTTVVYAAGPSGATVLLRRIHEVWTAPEMRLVVKVVDGDPRGFETVWGLEDASLQPDPSLFQPPPGYEMQHQASGQWAIADFEHLESWFAK